MRLIDAKSSQYVCQWIAVCCILHNIIIDTNDDSSEFDSDFEAALEEHEEQYANHSGRDEQENVVGEIKRKALYDQLVLNGRI